MNHISSELGIFAGAAERQCVREMRGKLRHSRIAGVIADLTRPDTPIIACNKAFADLTGYARREVVGQNCRFLNRGRVDGDIARKFKRSITDGRPFSTALENYRKDGTPFLNGVSISPIYGRNGDLVAMLGSQIDLTQYDPECHLQTYHRAQAKLSLLSDRQFEVVTEMAKGLLIKEIAFNIGIAPRTVKLHRAAAIKALGVSNSVEAIRIAIEAGY